MRDKTSPVCVKALATQSTDDAEAGVWRVEACRTGVAPGHITVPTKACAFITFEKRQSHYFSNA